MLLSKLKSLTKFKQKETPLIDLSALQEDLCNGLFGVMEKSFAQQQADAQNSNFTSSDVDKIIAVYAQRNMALAAAASIVPGPLGILGSIPELLLNFGNQMNMIYDLGCAYDKESFINKDLLLDIPFAAFGGNTNLANLQNLSQDLQDSPQDLLLEKASGLGKNIVERTLKKSVVQFIPVAGPILMSVWAKMTTQKIAKTSKSFLDFDANYTEHFKREETAAVKKELQIQKIKAFANLIESNNDINEAQIAFIGPIIENAAIADSEKEYLLAEALKPGSNFSLNYQLLQDYEEDESLIMELVILAKRSGSLDDLETAYIRQVAAALQLEKSFTEDLLT